MTKMLLVFSLILILTLPLFSQEIDTAWVRTYNGPGNTYDQALDIIVDDSEYVYVTGTAGTIKYDSTALRNRLAHGAVRK